MKIKEINFPTIPAHCPKCDSIMFVVKLVCPNCGTQIQGEFEPCPVCQLDDQSKDFFKYFILAKGNLKEIERLTGLSYPTVRNRTEELFRKFGINSKSILT